MDCQRFESVVLPELKANELKAAHRNLMPRDEILRDDVTQHILSFLGCNRTKSINKQFDSYADQNEEIYLKQIYQDDQWSNPIWNQE